MTSQIPPQNLEAERAVLGAMLIDAAAIPAVSQFVAPSDFYFPSHQRIFEAITALFNRKEPVDLITVTDFLNKSGQQISAADVAAMAANALPFHVEAYARIVKDSSGSRELLKALKRAEEEIYSAEDSLGVAGRLTSVLARIQDGGPKDFVHVEQVLVTTLKQIERAYEGGNPTTGVPTGFRDLDTRLGGIHPGDLVVAASRPGMGKTALVGDIAMGAAERGYGVCFVTAETPAPKIVQRRLAAATGIENRHLRRGLIPDGGLQDLIEKSRTFSNLPLWFLDSERSWDRIKAKIRSLKLRESILQLVVIDYVGLLSAPVPGGERYLEVGRISSEAKGLAIELGLGVILVSQLNREVEARPDKRPKLSDLRESGCLEQDADAVWLLYRPAYYDQTFRPRDLCELDVAKNRDGITGVLKLRFNEETVSFSNWIEPVGRDFYESARVA